MNYDLLKRILCLDGFVLENQVNVDGETVYIRPLYIEWLSLFPEIQMELAVEISKQIQKYNPQVLYAIEASILPLAALVAQELNIPLSIIRKPRNYKHEDDEPTIFIREELSNKPSVLLDDAIWSGYTIHYTLQEFARLDLSIPQCYFVFDFSAFCNGSRYLTQGEKIYIQKSDSWVSYQEIVEIAREIGLISELAYQKTVKLFCKA